MRRPWLAALLGAFVALLLVAAVAIPLAVAHRQDLPLERQYGRAVVSFVARLQAGTATNPLAGNARAVVTGGTAYVGSCASCHGAKGDGKGVFGPATYPDATDLTAEDTKEKSDAELFWITKHGLSFTAMPGFSDQYSDQAIWALVAYVRALQRGQPVGLDVPPPSAAEMAFADPFGSPAQRGAATYFAQGCQLCHGAVGNGPGELALRERGETGTIRRGTQGMPAYPTTTLSDAALVDLQAYLTTFSGGVRR